MSKRDVSKNLKEEASFEYLFFHFKKQDMVALVAWHLRLVFPS